MEVQLEFLKQVKCSYILHDITGIRRKNKSPTRLTSTTLRSCVQNKLTHPSHIYDVTVVRTKQAQSPVTRQRHYGCQKKNKSSACLTFTALWSCVQNKLNHPLHVHDITGVRRKTSQTPVSHLRRYGRVYKTSSITRYTSMTLRASEEKQAAPVKYPLKGALWQGAETNPKTNSNV